MSGRRRRIALVSAFVLTLLVAGQTQAAAAGDGRGGRATQAQR